MSAERLREAAASMRSRANRADGSEWLISGGTCGVGRPREGGRPFFVASTYGGLGAEEANAEHIAGMDPAVALAVADFLEFAAPFAHQPMPYAPTIDHAMRIARAYLPPREEQS